MPDIPDMLKETDAVSEQNLILSLKEIFFTTNSSYNITIILQ